MALYTYGIIDSSDQIKESIHGLDGFGVYNIPYCDIGVVVREFSEPVQNVTKSGVVVHEEVIERLMEYFTVLPMRFHTVFDSRDDIFSMMQSYYKDFKCNLDRLHNKVEFGIKVIWLSDKIKEHIANAHKESSKQVPVPIDSRNSEFVRDKFEKYRLNEEFERKANKFINVMDIFFSKFAVEKKLKKLRTDNLLLDAAYLVEKDRQDDFKEAFEHIKIVHTGFKFLFSGPWPPYNFVICRSEVNYLKTPSKKICLIK